MGGIFYSYLCVFYIPKNTLIMFVWSRCGFKPFFHVFRKKYFLSFRFYIYITVSSRPLVCSVPGESTKYSEMQQTLLMSGYWPKEIQFDDIIKLFGWFFCLLHYLVKMLLYYKVQKDHQIYGTVAIYSLSKFRNDRIQIALPFLFLI